MSNEAKRPTWISANGACNFEKVSGASLGVHMLSACTFLSNARRTKYFIVNYAREACAVIIISIDIQAWHWKKNHRDGFKHSIQNSAR